MEKGGYTYILTNKPRGVLYIGITGSIAARIMHHREGKSSAFARRYGLNRLVLIEHHTTIEDAIAREKAMKAWQREWKIELIERSNPDWSNLFETILA